MARGERKVKERQFQALEKLEIEELGKITDNAPKSPKSEEPRSEEEERWKTLLPDDVWYYIDGENKEFTYEHCLKELRFNNFYQRSLQTQIEWCNYQCVVENSKKSAYQRFADIYSDMLDECKALLCAWDDTPPVFDDK